MLSNQTERFRRCRFRILSLVSLMSVYFYILGTVSIKTQNYLQLVQYRNKYVTTGTLWSHNVQSIHICAIHCQNDIQCKSFFYGDITCSGYGEFLPNMPDLTTLNGMEFYRKESMKTDFQTILYLISSFTFRKIIKSTIIV